MLDKRRGYWHSAELLTAALMADAGWVVSVPLIPVRYDLIGDWNGRLLRIQVKRARWKEQRRTKAGLRDRACYTLMLTRRNGKKGAASHNTVESDEFDYLAVMCTFQDVYFIPVAALTSPEVAGKLIRMIQIKPPDPTNTRADAEASGARWEPYRNNFVLHLQ